ncbi:hypothetical protein KFE25_009990 [Diacronema lutheri]|uniref:Uncharacterized protein n=1 Tax=Diacronema lutheri TaxID=2081491 RepID=A0A8J5XI88_DIALT|nr:hypothetical protein KFE25_009990 [Diacronema lutheri]
MIQASKDELEMELQASFVEIRKREMAFYVTNCRSLGTQAALIAAFSFSGISADLHDSHGMVKAIYMTCITSAMGFAFTSLINSMMASMLGPGYALRGPEGSYHHATESMMYEYKIVGLNLLLAMNMFYFAAFAYVWLAFHWSLSVPVFVLMAVLYERTIRYSLLVMNTFRLPTGLAISGRINMDGTITPYTALSPVAIELEVLRRRPPAPLRWLRIRWLAFRVEVDEFLGTSDLRESDGQVRPRTEAELRAEAEATRVAMRNMLYNIEHGAVANRRAEMSLPLRRAADSAAAPAPS